MSVIVVATIFPKQEHLADVVDALKEVIAKVHAEDIGCELYSLHAGEDRLVFIEKWVTAEALTNHSQSAGSEQLRSVLKGRVSAASDVQVLQAIAAGTPKLGVL